jgi:hypothetical protein
MLHCFEVSFIIGFVVDRKFTRQAFVFFHYRENICYIIKYISRSFLFLSIPRQLTAIHQFVFVEF